MLKLPKNRAARIGGQAAVLIALVGGTAAYASQDTTVQLTVDGVEEEVRVFGTTVDEVLEAADVEVGERDVVAPALGERVQDGSDVVVRHARLLTLTVDGKTQEHWTTALTVDEALADLNLRAEDARLSASRSTPLGRDGLELEVVTAKDVTVLADGTSSPVTTTAETVADVLEQAGVAKDEDDSVKPGPATPVTDGMSIQVFRVATAEVVETEPVAFTTKTVDDADLYEGESETATAGKNGVRTLTYAVTTTDGKETARELVSDEVTTAPVTKVVHVGTKNRPAPKPKPKPEPAPARSSSSSSGSSSGGSSSGGSSAPPVSSGSVWDRLAQCESGGDWSINTGNGYYGGLQFSASSWRAVGGTGLPHQHSREVQIQMGERLKAVQGWGAWPACSLKLGLR